MSTTSTPTFTRREVATPQGAFILHEVGHESGAAASTPVLLIHDQIASAPRDFAAALAAQRDVRAPIVPGFGESERPAWVGSVRDVADHLLFLLDAVDLGPVHLVGTSMGAWIAADLALRLGTDCRSLSLLSPVGIRVKGHPAADFWYERERDSILFNDPAAMPQLTGEEMVANEESAARYGWTPRLFDPTLTARLGRLAAPTLIVWSAEDRVLPRAHRDAWRTVIPTAELAEVPGGHFACHEHPDDAAAAVLAFVARHDA